MKTASIGQAIMYATRPRVSHNTDTPGFSGEFIQYVADNVDHKIRTLDGNNTFHGMEMIAAVTSATKSTNPILRANATPHDISMASRVPILFHKEEGQGTDTVTYQKLAIMEAQDPTADMEDTHPVCLTKVGMVCDDAVCNAWQPSREIILRLSPNLPMIDMNPSDATCIFSTLKFVSEHARRHHVKPIITLDPPLWWKALMIISAEPEGNDLNNIVLRLGGFHTEMSFLGAIGHLMAESGLQ
ncbi:hypothetical protein MAR_003820 [Mya arenaria]|uniref:Uncharacterized protein n=1 Tax=Mya arenaria TaxID=6604 RepID=A0ABY7EUT5_MYAAR|nr:hypothetical protein MAR_003820 [Mya arenaria]